MQRTQFLHTGAVTADLLAELHTIQTEVGDAPYL